MSGRKNINQSRWFAGFRELRTSHLLLSDSEILERLRLTGQEPSMVAHAFKPNIWEAEKGRSL